MDRRTGPQGRAQPALHTQLPRRRRERQILRLDGLLPVGRRLQGEPQRQVRQQLRIRALQPAQQHRPEGEQNHALERRSFGTVRTPPHGQPFGRRYFQLHAAHAFVPLPGHLQRRHAGQLRKAGRLEQPQPLQHALQPGLPPGVGRQDPVEHQTGAGPEIHHSRFERPRKRQFRLRRQLGDAARLLAEPLPRQRPRRRGQPDLHHDLVGIARNRGSQVHLDELPAQDLHRGSHQLPAYVQLRTQRGRHDPLHAEGAAEERSGASLPQAERRGPRDLFV